MLGSQFSNENYNPKSQDRITIKSSLSPNRLPLVSIDPDFYERSLPEEIMKNIPVSKYPVNQNCLQNHMISPNTRGRIIN